MLIKWLLPLLIAFPTFLLSTKWLKPTFGKKTGYFALLVLLALFRLLKLASPKTFNAGLLMATMDQNNT